MIAVIAVGFIFSFFFTYIFTIMQLLLFALLAFGVIDLLILFLNKNVTASRTLDDKLSNGDDNPITITVSNSYAFSIHVAISDEIPVQFQIRDFMINADIAPNKQTEFTYSLHPTTRGIYTFGALHILVASPLQLFIRRYSFDEDKEVAVYPSIIQMKKYDFYAISHRLKDIGIKKIRTIGASFEFEQIRNYNTGDDIKKINWKATARKNELMVNHFQEERSQHIYSVINTGRVMKMPFKGMSLLDYAINASLVMSNIALRREDKAGIITYSNTLHSFLPAKTKFTQLQNILETLYKVDTNFAESDFENLYIHIINKIKQRSLIILYTNFETLTGLHRNLKYIKMLAKKHIIVTIFFKNTELKELLDCNTNSTEDIYMKAIAEKFAYEKKQIVKELALHGIHSILTSPEDLSVNTINKYLELKSRGLI